MRGKEEAHDYRYFPDPDLAPLRLDPAWIQEIRDALPELPIRRYDRFQEEFALSAYHADVLVKDKDVADFFEECVAEAGSPQEVANWVVNAVREEMNTRRVSVREIGIRPSALAELVKATAEGKVSKQKARDVFKAMLGSEKSVDEVIASLGLGQISDDGLLREAVAKAIEAHPAAADDVRAGKKNSVNFLMGQVMRQTRGKANPAIISQLIEEMLAGD
jgi:aspartyl-tRNA(Asn)/glutamyl-tRNA(Gln) amidotransferase subunit B